MRNLDELGNWLAATCARVAGEAVAEMIRDTSLSAIPDGELDTDELRRIAQRSVERKLGETIVADAPTIEFLPIVHLETCAVIAREAVIAPAPGTEPLDDDHTIALRSELEIEALRVAMRVLEQAKDSTFMCVNVSRLLGDARLVEMLLEFPCDRLVLELDADFDLAVFRSLRGEIDQLRHRGARIALNGVGTGTAELERVMIVEPEIIKIDVGAAQRLGRDLHRRAMVGEIVDVGRHAGAFVIATGIESSEQISVAQELGVDAGEGMILLLSSGVPAPITAK